MIVTETYCKCEICGKKMYEEETGHKRYQNYLELGSNVDSQFTKRYDDICDECATAIQNTIIKRQGKRVISGDECFSTFEKDK